MTKTDILRKMYHGLAAQGWKEARQGGNCAYLTSDNLRCGVGQLFDIPTDPYERADLEGLGSFVHDVGIANGRWESYRHDTLSNFLNKNNIPGNLEIKLMLADAQSAHDNYYVVAPSLQERFTNFCRRNGYDPVTE